MDAEAEHPQLRSILANLSQEICRPLDSLRVGIGRFLEESDRPISDAERVQAQTMLTLCDDLGLLTRERLGGPPTAEG
jgi:signal transduction histidine kinase